MHSIAEIGTVVNIDAELAHWRLGYVDGPFYCPGLAFADYVPSLKFAYDSYLRYHREPLALMLPELRDRYPQSVAEKYRLDWEQMVDLLGAVWGRLRPAAEPGAGRSCTAAPVLRVPRRPPPAARALRPTGGAGESFS